LINEHLVLSAKPMKSVSPEMLEALFPDEYALNRKGLARADFEGGDVKDDCFSHLPLFEASMVPPTR
jgi:hypothetical protein